MAREAASTGAAPAEWSIQQIAKLAGTTSRTLRHYGDIGLLNASRIGANGYRYYDRDALVRLQRILLLRELGLGLPAIADVLDGQADASAALGAHITWLRQEQQRLARQIAAVEKTRRSLEGGEEIMAEEMFDGFDPAQYKDEVEQRWGEDAYARSNAWWSSMSETEKRDFMRQHEQIAADYASARERGVSADADEVLAVAGRHFRWLNVSTPVTGGVGKDMFVGYGEMYVADERFAANYGGREGAEYVRDAMRAYAAARL